MNKPQLVLFEYGQTLIRKTNSNPYFALKMIFKDQSDNILKQIQSEFLKQTTPPNELNIRIILNNICEKFEIPADVPLSKAEDLLTEFGMLHESDPDSDKLIDFLEANGIVTAILGISPISQHGLINLFKRMFPENATPLVAIKNIEDYKALFRSIIDRSNMNTTDIWFCGSSKIAIETASEENIIPVFCSNQYRYTLARDELAEETPQTQRKLIKCDFITIDSTIELLPIIDNLE